MFQKYLPGAELTNTLPPFCEPEGPPVAEEDQEEEEPAEAGVSDGSEESRRLDAGVVTREATACVEEVLAATSSYSSSGGVLQ